MDLLLNTATNNFDDDVALAVSLSRDAGELLRMLRDDDALSGKSLGDAGDKQANDLLIHALKKHRPNDAILSEESVDDFARLTAHRVWIIDPLDGTREYRERRDDWAVHVALVSDRRVIAAAVAMPSRGEVFSTAKNSAEKTGLAFSNHALSNDEPNALSNIIVISRSRPPTFADRVAKALNAQLQPVGSAGAKAMMVVRGDALAYVHDGGMNEWDAAAPVGVALAHGCCVCDLHGNDITFNRRDVVLRGGLIVCRADLRETILRAL
jgi:3'(2'), 5'-bisphosphate nucleotidase